MATAAESAVDSAAKWTAAAFGVVTTGLGAVGATGGGLERILRNELFLSTVAFFLIFVGIVVAILARPMIPLPGTSAGGGTVTLIIAFIFFAGGLGLALYLGVASPSMRERPLISASITEEKGLLVAGSVRASGISSKSSLIVFVDGLTGPERVPTRLFKSQMGPDREGLVEMPLSIEIPRGAFDEVAIAAVFDAEQREKCREGNLSEGCLIMQLPDVPRAPQLSLDVEGSSLAVEVKGTIHREASLVVKAFTRPRSDPLLFALLAPDARGSVDSSFDVQAPPGSRSVCVAAGVVDPKPSGKGWSAQEDFGLKCSPDAREEVAWSRVRLVPSRAGR